MNKNLQENKEPSDSNASKKPSQKRRILVTAGLPYANSSLHIGHLVEYLQADFWTRFQKMRGHECHYICGDDTHGTAIMVAARQKGISPEEHIRLVWEEHFEDFKNFQIEFSHYSSTHTPENQKLCEEFYFQMNKNGHIKSKVINQLYCEHDKMFLPDRFVKGSCPKCNSENQYGDNCDKCSATYAPTDLKNPQCSTCGNTPVLKNSEHLLFQLDHFRTFLESWLPLHTSKEVTNKMKEWFKEPLRDWDISRDAPYFGFPIPNHKDKFFYVWVDAPMGYISATLQFCNKNQLSFDDFWKNQTEASSESLKEGSKEISSKEPTEVYHLIGKDIMYFHTLFWPALLKCANFRTPNQVFVHGHLTINGEKMSKSKGTQIQARGFLKHLDPTYLRYYYASKMSSGMDDMDLSFDDFTQRVNSDLIGKITNLGSRSAQMLKKKMDGQLSSLNATGLELMKRFDEQSENIASHYENRDFQKAIQEIRALADESNRYFDEAAPWKSLQQNPVETKAVLSTALNAFRKLCIFLKPVLPLYSEKVAALFGEKNYQWADQASLLEKGMLGDYEHLVTRIDPEKVKQLLAENL